MGPGGLTVNPPGGISGFNLLIVVPKVLSIVLQFYIFVKKIVFFLFVFN